MKECTFHFTLGLKVPHYEHEIDQLSHETLQLCQSLNDELAIHS